MQRLGIQWFRFLLLVSVGLVGCTQSEPSIQELTTRAERGDAAAQFQLGKIHLLGNKPDDNEAFKWLSKSAIRNYPPGQHLLGTMYEDGKGTSKSNEEALKYFQRAAAKGFPAAQNRIGEQYLHGRDVPRDFDLAAKWFEKAAKQGLADGQYNLGQRYYKGEGVAQSDEESTRLLTKAAKQGHGMAQSLLAHRFLSGDAGEIDYVHAYKWARLSGQDDILRQIEQKASKEQIRKGETEASKFIPVLELDPTEPPKSRLTYWISGLLGTALYGVVVYFLVKKRKPTSEAT